MMPLCGRSGLDSCPSVTGLEAAGRKRRRLVFAPAKSKRKPLSAAPAQPSPPAPLSPPRHHPQLNRSPNATRNRLRNVVFLLRDSTFRTAKLNAFGVPTTTTNLFPRVIPVYNKFRCNIT